MSKKKGLGCDGFDQSEFGLIERFGVEDVSRVLSLFGSRPGYEVSIYVTEFELYFIGGLLLAYRREPNEADLIRLVSKGTHREYRDQSHILNVNGEFLARLSSKGDEVDSIHVSQPMIPGRMNILLEG